MPVKILAWLAISILIACSLALASDAILGPVTGTQSDGRLSSSLLLSRFSVEVLVYLAASVKAALASPAVSLAGIQSTELIENLVTRMALIAAISLFVSGTFFLSGRGEKRGDSHISGMQLLSGKDAQDDVKQQFRGEITGDRKSDLKTIYLAPSMPITPNQETRGIFIEGGVGSGKTVILRSILSQAIERDDKVILYDVKGDFAPKVRKRLVFNPFAQGSAVWAVARDVRTADQARQLARMLLPADAGKDDFWNKAALAVLSGIFITLQAEAPGRWTFRDVYWMLLSPRDVVIDKLNKYYPAAAKFFGEKGSSNLEHGVWATLTAQLSPFVEPLAIAWGNPRDQKEGFSFETWLLSENAASKVIVLQGSPEHADASAAWIRMAINFLAGVLVSPRVENDGSLRLWLLVDELPSLGNVPRLTEIIDRGREKGVRTIVACQNLAQVAQHYSEWAQSAETTFGIRIFSKMSPGERTQSIIKSVGERQVKVRSITTVRNADGSTSRSERWVTERLPVLTPDIFGSLGVKGKRGVDALVIGLTSNVLRAHWPFPSKRPNYHPPFKLRNMDRGVLSRAGMPPASTKASVVKSFGLRLDDAIEEFDAKKPHAKE